MPQAARRARPAPRATPDAELPGLVIHRTDSDRHSAAVIRTDPVRLAVQGHAGWPAEPVSFEQLVLAHLQHSPQAATTGNPAQATAWPGPAGQAVARR